METKLTRKKEEKNAVLSVLVLFFALVCIKYMVLSFLFKALHLKWTPMSRPYIEYVDQPRMSSNGREARVATWPWVPGVCKC